MMELERGDPRPRQVQERLCAPDLSTVRMPIERMGTSPETLLQQRQRNPRSSPCSIVLRAEWLSRATCDRPRPSST